MNRKRTLFLTVALMCAAAVAVRADQVDDYVKAEMQKQRIPAVSIAIVKNGAVIKAEGYGLADIEHNIPAKPDTVFKIGSVSKQFLATGIMLLVQEGKIALDDKIGKYLEGTPETWQGITLRHLLTHTSGIVREGPGFDPYKVQSDIDVIKTAYPLPLRFAPGSKWEYCNVGYFALAEIIHKVSGKSWGEFLNERVFTPLGMSSTRVTSVADIIPNRADGYMLKGDKLQNTENWPAVRPSGAFLSTVLDLAKWEAALLTEKVLKSSTKTEMWTPFTLTDGRKYAYGFGWELEDFRGVPMIRHGGSLTGFRANYMRWPSYGLTVIVLTNLASANVESLGNGIAVRYVPELNLAALQPQTAADPEMTKVFRGVLTDYANGVKELPQATSELRAALAGAPQSARDSLAGRLKEGGALEFLTQKNVKENGILRLGAPVASIWHYRLGTGERVYYYTFYLTSERRVAYLESSTY